MPPPPKGNYDHYIECKYCGRKYAPDVAERHIPKCANIINKPGGIKPSKIQEKYVGNTGAGSSKISSTAYGTGSKILPEKPSPVITTTKAAYGVSQTSKTTSSYKPQVGSIGSKAMKR